VNFLRPVQTVTAQGPVHHRQIVAWGTGDGTGKAATGPLDAIVGIADYPGGACDTGRVDVVRAGITEVVLGAPVTRGDPLTSDAAGCAVTAAHHGHPENLAAVYTQNATTGAATYGRIVGYAEISGVAGDVITVLVAPGLI
jgi:hypothetical protein